jgi:tetraacyldisaccharide 4'-kinase
MKWLRIILLFPLSLIYGLVMSMRNLAFNMGWKKSMHVKNAISVGNLAVGGTGKTPAIKFLIKHFSSDSHTVVVSRGYGRKSKGLVELKENTPSAIGGDEPTEILSAFPETRVVVAEKRVEAVNYVQSSGNDKELFLFDDLFQHRYVKPGVNILLSTFQNPYFKDFVMPSGWLREFRSGVSRADIIVFTKCPKNLEREKADEMMKRARVSTPVFFAGMKYDEVRWKFGENGSKDVLAFSAIANPAPFMEHMNNCFNVVIESNFNDHYTYKEEDVQKLVTMAKADKLNLICTAKDYVKIREFDFIFKNNGINLGVLNVEMEILFDQKKEFIEVIQEKLK